MFLYNSGVISKICEVAKNESENYDPKHYQETIQKLCKQVRLDLETKENMLKNVEISQVIKQKIADPQTKECAHEELTNAENDIDRLINDVDIKTRKTVELIIAARKESISPIIFKSVVLKEFINDDKCYIPEVVAGEMERQYGSQYCTQVMETIKNNGVSPFDAQIFKVTVKNYILNAFMNPTSVVEDSRIKLVLEDVSEIVGTRESFANSVDALKESRQTLLHSIRGQLNKRNRMDASNFLFNYEDLPVGKAVDTAIKNLKSATLQIRNIILGSENEHNKSRVNSKHVKNLSDTNLTKLEDKINNIKENPKSVFTLIADIANDWRELEKSSQEIK